MSDDAQGDPTAVSVNFGKPFPLFPLDTVTLLPQQVLPLHIFEPRYRQLVEHAVDGVGQLAMGVFRGDRWKEEYHGNPPVLPAVCIGQIVQHERQPDGRFFLILQGICRGRIVGELMPDERRLYREVRLEPIGPDADILRDPAGPLEVLRARLESVLSEGPLRKLSAAGPILEYVRNDDVSTTSLLELVSFTIVSDRRVRYRLLEEGDAEARAAVIDAELNRLEQLIRRACAQRPQDWPKGCSWN
jgi:Lon protease-like protein